MSEHHGDLIAAALLERTGVAVTVTEPRVQGIRRSLVAILDGYTSQNGPRFSIQPHGLKSHKVKLVMGDYSAPCLALMRQAAPDKLPLARAFIRQLTERPENKVKISPEQALAEWQVPENGGFSIEVITRLDGDQYSDEAFAATAENVMAPLLAAIGELIGFDESDQFYCQKDQFPFDVEGRLTTAVVRKRERSRRNKMLCLLIHGPVCRVCGFIPEAVYPSLRNIIEVHHIEPVSELAAPKPYNPRTDLIPLCPNCHRAIHTRVPAYLPEELRAFMEIST